MLEGWKKTSLAHIGGFKNGLNKDKGSFGRGHPFVNLQDLFGKLEVSSAVNLGKVEVSESEVNDYALKKGDVLFARSSVKPEGVGLTTLVASTLENTVFSGFIIRLRINPEKADPSFVNQAMHAEKYRRAILRRSTISANTNVNQEALSQIELHLPPIDEQRRISEILRTWDTALEKLATLRVAKVDRLSALRFAMLFGELRLDDTGRSWASTRLAAVTHELTGRNGANGLGRDFVMGVTKAQGVVPMREQTIASDISRYKRLPPRAFAYNPMRINVGSIAMNERDEEVLVSPDYVVFACNADGLDPDYLDHLRKTSWWAHYINSGGSGSVRQRTYYDDLAALKLPLPDLDEQKAIAAVLNTARDDLAATEREIEAVTLQKRGLMQKLLTGEWRVNSEKVPA